MDTKYIILIIILIFLFVVCCIHIISNKIEKVIIEENKALIGFAKSLKKENKLLYKILNEVRRELSLLKLKECPEEEFKNIPFELIGWLEEIMKVKDETSCQEHTEAEHL